VAKQYDNTNRGALFKNDKKESNKHPDYKGNINVDGREYWLSGWLKESQAGKKYFSLSVSPKEKQGEDSQVPPKGQSADDDVPF
jgi:hypothetical protein